MALMTPARLIELLEASGSVACEIKKPSYEAAFYFSHSLAIRDAEDAARGPGKGSTIAWKRKARAAPYLSPRRPCRRA